ncbi:undecaprenyl-phosphate glucose phosphotransferase [Ottowia thiooxydans]|uniref:undecaprenyl-phosphate glucose phosphotransferase n=1 Tax=Ottowia thiooxydans TaxID=219182 RepID=UPI0004119447|nr:undecaprenyl-phosphate glucose phosphotransferase [Ottowia thiooxydans]
MAALWLAGEWLNSPWSEEHLLMALLSLAFFNLSAGQWLLYRSWRIAPLRAELSRALVCCCATMLLLMAVLYVVNPWPDMPRALVPVWGLLAYAMLGGGRVVLRLTLRTLRRRGSNFRVAAVIGANDTSFHVIEQLRRNPWMGIRILGVFEGRRPEVDRVFNKVPITGDLNDLMQRIRQGDVDIVYITLPLRAELRIRQLVDQLRDSAVSVLFVADFSPFGLLRARWDVLGGMPMVSLVDTPHHGVDGVLKRAVDIALASFALVILALPMMTIALAIRATSKGTAIFAQRRYGLDGKEFFIYKFRSMAVVEDGKNEFVQARKGDMRITPLGAFLRRTSLDELPQFINVLQGRMSLVGPRPHPVALNESQRKLIDGYMLRHKVKPGITGWAQVHGFRGETDTPDKMENRIRYDLEYINEWSLWLDIRILWMTVFKVLDDPNAY